VIFLNYKSRNGQRSFGNHKRKYRYILFFIIAVILIIAVIDNSTTILKMNYPMKYSEYVFKYSEVYNLDPYLIFAIIKAESSFNPKARSVRDARGLMQITEKTAKWGAESIKIEGFELEDLYDPETNIRIGCWYMRQLLNEFGNDTDLAITAYNGGSGNVKMWLDNEKYSKSGTRLDVIPFKETDRFLKRVKRYYHVYKKLYAGT